MGSGSRSWISNGTVIPVMSSDSDDQDEDVVQRYDSAADAQVLVLPTNFSTAVYTCTSDYSLWGVASQNSSILIADANGK